MPFNVILILPERESNNDKFGLTVSKVRPVIDIAIDDVIKHGTMPPGWINITYHDSRYWEDTLLAERVSATGVVQVCKWATLSAIIATLFRLIVKSVWMLSLVLPMPTHLPLYPKFRPDSARVCPC